MILTVIALQLAATQWSVLSEALGMAPLGLADWGW